MKEFLALALLLPAFATTAEIPLAGERYGDNMGISDLRQCYVYGQCQDFSVDFSQQDDAESCHAFCGKLEGCNWWSWEPAQSLCLAFENCTETGGPSGNICEDCISGEKLCPARDCHKQSKCVGHFVDSFVMSHIEECIVACNSHDDCKWYTLEKTHDHCMLYEDCDFHEESCTTCATGPKYCSHGYHAEDGTIFTQDNLEEMMNEQSKYHPEGRCGPNWINPLDGKPYECDPHANALRKGPCCSQYGYCGNTDAHCKCANCHDFSLPSSLSVPDWRDDLRCGPNYPLQDGRPAQCDPNAVYPCCSPAGWCGNTDAHCKCSGCDDFRPNTPVDCQWGEWSGWESCDVTCGGGTQTSTRVILQEAQHGGAACAGDFTRVQGCNTDDCPVDCQLGEWSGWESCSATCGGGTQTSTRVILREAAHGGAACAGDLTKVQGCNTDDCPVDCQLGKWTGWGSCSAKCGGGTQTSTRVILRQAQHGGTACVGDLTRNQPCNTNDCPDWRDDGRCGPNNKLADGRDGQCDPNANANEKGPCCSTAGWCGNSRAHCGNGGTDFSTGPLPVGQPCGDGDTCADGGRCHIRCCHKDLAMPDNVAECGSDGWYVRCKPGYEHDGMTGCVQVSGSNSQGEYFYDYDSTSSTYDGSWYSDYQNSWSGPYVQLRAWRDDGRCGPNFKLADGRDGECDPNANANEKGPCCSKAGWCGNSRFHCGNGGTDFSADACDSATQFKCLNGICKPAYESYDSRCKGSCMPYEWKCDGMEGCTDGSDESTDTCPFRG